MINKLALKLVFSSFIYKLIFVFLLDKKQNKEPVWTIRGYVNMISYVAVLQLQLFQLSFKESFILLNIPGNVMIGFLPRY